MQTTSEPFSGVRIRNGGSTSMDRKGMGPTWLRFGGLASSRTEGGMGLIMGSIVGSVSSTVGMYTVDSFSVSSALQSIQHLAQRSVKVEKVASRRRSGSSLRSLRSSAVSIALSPSVDAACARSGRQAQATKLRANERSSSRRSVFCVAATTGSSTTISVDGIRRRTQRSQLASLTRAASRLRYEQTSCRRWTRLHSLTAPGQLARLVASSPVIRSSALSHLTTPATTAGPTAPSRSASTARPPQLDTHRMPRL